MLIRPKGPTVVVAVLASGAGVGAARVVADKSARVESMDVVFIVLVEM